MNAHTLYGGRALTVTFEPATSATPDAPLRTEEIRVRQIPIRDYDAGFKCFTDEVALVAFLAGQPREWAFTLLPESYEEILALGREVNERGFFASCRRRMEADLNREIAISTAVSQMPEDVRRVVLEAGAKAMGLETGSDSFSPPRPRRV